MAVLGIQVALLAGGCWWIFRSVQLDSIIRAVKNCPWELTLGALLLFVTERLVRSCRLALLFRGAIPVTTMIASQSASQLFNLILPMRAGEIVLIFLLRSLKSVSGSMALSLVLVDRVMDIIAILIIFAVTIALVPGVPPVVNSGAILLGLGCAVAVFGTIILVVAREQVLAIFQICVRRLPLHRSVIWYTRLKGLLEGLAIVRSPGWLALAFMATSAVWVLAIGGFAMILKGIWPAAPTSVAALAVSFGAIGVALVSAPAGIGILHAGYALAAILFGASQEVALAFAVLTHFLGLVATLIVGLFGLAPMRRAGLQIMRRVT